MVEKEKKCIQTYNVRLVPDEPTYRYWADQLTNIAEAYDMCISLLSDGLTPLTMKAVHKTCYKQVRAAFPKVTAQGAIRAQKEAMSALRSRKSNKHNGELPEKHALSMTLDKRIYARLTDKSIALCGGTKGKRVAIPFAAYDKLTQMFSEYKPCDPTLFMRDGSLWLSIPFTVPQKPLKDETSVGVDLGGVRFFVTSDGYAFRDKEYTRNRRKARYLKRCLKKKGTKSAKRHLKKLRHKEYNQSKDMQYRMAKVLLQSTDASIIVLEDLRKIKQTTSKTKDGHGRKRHNNMLSQVPFAAFRSKLEAKAPLYGKKVVTVNPAFTSQTDSRTSKKEGVRKGRRFYGADGIVLDADWNAAVNIAKKAKHPLSNPCPVDGRIVFLCGRAMSTARTYVSHGTPCITSPRL